MMVDITDNEFWVFDDKFDVDHHTTKTLDT